MKEKTLSISLTEEERDTLSNGLMLLLNEIIDGTYSKKTPGGYFLTFEDYQGIGADILRYVALDDKLSELDFEDD